MVLPQKRRNGECYEKDNEKAYGSICASVIGCVSVAGV